MTTAQHDLDVLKDRLNKIKVDTFDSLRYFIDADGNMLRNSGYKTREQALTTIIRRRMNEIETLIRAYEKKWPS